MASAAISIKRGDLILKSQPFAYVLFDNYRGLYCDFCLQENNSLRRCSKCSFSYFCNVECQKSAWKDHKMECSSLQRIHPEKPEEFVRLMARVIYKLKRKPGECVIFGNITRRFQDLNSHNEHLKNNQYIISRCSTITQKIKDFIPSQDCPSTMEISEIFGKIATNSSPIIVCVENVGQGVYLGGRIFRHSCEPNAAVVYDGRAQLISALEDIFNSDATSVFVNFIDLMATTEERQQELKKTFYFNCKCKRCQDKEKNLITESILCPNEKCTEPTIIKENSFICLKCGQVKFDKNKLQQIQKLTEKCKKTLGQIDKLKISNKYQEISDITKACIEQSKSTFHYLNVHYARILEKAFEINMRLNKWESVCELGEQLLLSSRYYYGEFHPFIGITLQNTGFALFMTGKYAEAYKTLRLALEVFAITHPKHNTVYSSCEYLLSLCQMKMRFNDI